MTSTSYRVTLGILFVGCGNGMPAQVNGRDASFDGRARPEAGRDGGIDANDGSARARDGGIDVNDGSAGPGDGGADAGGCSAGVPGVTCVATTPSNRTNFVFAVDETNVYWGEQGSTMSDSVIVKASRAGGSVTTIATARLYPLRRTELTSIGPASRRSPRRTRGSCSRPRSAEGK
jgi:hypothetical protein